MSYIELIAILDSTLRLGTPLLLACLVGLILLPEAGGWVTLALFAGVLLAVQLWMELDHHLFQELKEMRQV